MVRKRSRGCESERAGMRRDGVCDVYERHDGRSEGRYADGRKYYFQSQIYFLVFRSFGLEPDMRRAAARSYLGADGRAVIRTLLRHDDILLRGNIYAAEISAFFAGEED